MTRRTEKAQQALLHTKSIERRFPDLMKDRTVSQSADERHRNLVELLLSLLPSRKAQPILNAGTAAALKKFSWRR